jgi:serine/threonine protein kinase
MSSLAPIELVEFLTRNQLLGHAQLETLARDSAKYVSCAQLTDELVAKGWLTKYQQSYLLSGQGDKLIIGPYRLIDVLGEGGMGMVFKGWHPRLDRYVALKLIRPQVLASRPEIVTRFHREARAIAQLHHPNVVLLYDADEVGGTHYIAMEYVDGVTLEKMVRQNGPLAVRQACDYVRQAALGLQHAAECGLVHRDIKPANILVTTKTAGVAKRSSSQLKRPALVTVRDRELAAEGVANGRGENAWGVVKVLDMGLARLQESLEEADVDPLTPLTRAGALLGTPDFIAPEQARDARTVDIRADLYSLGCTFYYVLSGRPPFPGGNDVQKLIKHQTEKPYPLIDLRPHLPSFVNGLVERLMAKEAADRYQTPQELADVLADYLASTAPGAAGRGSSPGTETPTGATDSSPAPVSTTERNESPLEQSLSDLVRGFDSSDDETDPLTSMGREDPPSGEVPAASTIQAHTGVVSAVALSRDGRYAATGGVDGKIRLWDLAGQRPSEVACVARPQAEMQALSFAPDDSRYLVFGATQQGNARVQRWDWGEGLVVEWGGFATNDGRGVGGLAFAADGTMFAAGVGSFAVTWKVHKRNATGRSILKGQGAPVRCIAFSPDHRLMVTAGESAVIRFWGFGWLGASLKASVEAHPDGVTSVAFAPDGKRLATVGLDRQVAVWDPLTPSASTVVVMSGHATNLKHVQFLPGGKHLLAVGESGQVLIWDVASTLVVQEFTLDLSLAYCLTVSADGRRVVAGYSNGMFAVFNLTITPPPPIPAASATLAGRR